MTERGPDEPRQLLPGELLPAGARSRLIVSDVPIVTTRSVEQLEREGLVATGWQEFDRRERAVATWLLTNGVEVRSVEASRIDGRRTPDAVLRDVTVEFKTLAKSGPGPVARNLRTARLQSRRAIIDGRDVGLDEDAAVSGLADALRRSGADLDEVVLLLADGRGLHWP